VMTRANNAERSAPWYLYEALLSGALAFAFLTGLLWSGDIYWTGQFGGWSMGLNHSFQRRYNDHLGVALAFYLWSLALGLVVFVLLRLVSRIASITKAVRTTGGIAVAAGPLVALWVAGQYRPADLYRGWWWLRFEGCAAIGCAVLYAYDRWVTPAWLTVVLLTLHAAIWTYAYSATFEYHGLQWLTAPIAAYFSCMAWGYCTSLHREQTIV
jgi:hypothetical protein